jgi:uncharacterized membrane protein YgcG
MFRRCFSQRVTIIGFACMVPAFASAQEAAIMYTGQTYGYLRSEDVSKPDSLAHAFVLSRERIAELYPQAILVGTGDNFAPDYGARFDANNQPLSRIDGPDRGCPLTTVDLKSGAVQFFLDEHYDALVPGRYDFYFGAEFLRRAGACLPMLGANVAIAPVKPLATPQPLCAANPLLLPTQVSLPIQSAGKGQQGQSGGSGGAGGSGGSQSKAGGSKGGSSGSNSGQTQSCLTPLQGGAPGSTAGFNLFPSADAIYPWSTEFQFTLTSDVLPSSVHAEICERAPKSEGFYDPNTQKDWCKPLKSQGSTAASATMNLYAFNVDGPNVPIRRAHYGDQDTVLVSLDDSGDSRGRLLPGSNLAICIQGAYALGKGDDNRPFSLSCVPFQVQHPIFPTIWVEIQEPSVNYAIFGAVDPSIQGLISNDDSRWAKGKSDAFQVSMADPELPVSQAVYAFASYHHADYPNWKKVLLAGMPPAAAKSLATALSWDGYGFLAVISAADNLEKTPNMTLLVPSSNLGSNIPAPIAPVITPHPVIQRGICQPAPAFHPPGCTRGQAAWAADYPLELLAIGPETPPDPVMYTNYSDMQSPVFPAALKTTVANIKDRACAQLTFLLNDLDTKLNPTQGPQCNDDSAFKCSTLRKMKETLDADIGMLQLLDLPTTGCVYEFDPHGPLSATINRLFPGGSLLTRASLSGATLRAVLQASDTIAAADASSTNPPVQPDRELVYVGVTRAQGTYYVNGVAIDDSKIYSVATSDRLALGDDKYPQFAQVDLASPSVFRGNPEQSYRIADLAESALTAAEPPLVPRSDVIAQAIWPTSSNSTKSSKTIADNGDPFEKVGPIEREAQDRSFWTVTLQQATASYSFSKPNKSDQNIAQNLAGVTNPNVAAPHNESVSFGDNLRAIQQFTTDFDWGTDEQLTYSKNRQGNLSATSTAITTPSGTPVPSDSISLSANTLIVSPFAEFQRHRYQPHWKYLVLRPATYSTDVAQNRQFLKTAVKTEEYELTLERQWNWQPSIGTRLERDNLNYFEFGFIHQNAMDVLSGLTVNGVFTPTTSGATPSSITTPVTPKPGDVAIPSFNTFHQNGGYWLGMYTRKLPYLNKVVYQGVTYGNFFAYGSFDRTSSVLSRYAVEFGNSLQIPVLGNLSFGPAFNMFFFQDQSHANGNSLIRKDLFLQLNYLFDWHEGLAWSDALKGKSN